MIVVYWLAAVLLVALLLPSTLYYGAYLLTRENYPRKMALRCIHWALVVLLATFNISILQHIIVTILAWF